MLYHDYVQVALSLSLSLVENILYFLLPKVCQPPVVQSTFLHPLPWPVFWTVGWTLILCFVLDSSRWALMICQQKHQNLLWVSFKVEDYVKNITFIKWIELSLTQVLKRKCMFFCEAVDSSLSVDSIWIPVDVDPPKYISSCSSLFNNSCFMFQTNFPSSRKCLW